MKRSDLWLPRFEVTPAWRRARRGGGGDVRDGWHLTDTITMYTVWRETIDELAGVRAHCLEQEDEVVKLVHTARTFTVEWSGRTPLPLVTAARLVLQSGPVPTRDETRYGHPTVPWSYTLGIYPTTIIGQRVRKHLDHLGIGPADTANIEIKGDRT